GDPEGEQLHARDREEQIGGGVAGRVAAVLGYYRPLAGLVQIRLHDTPLYNSIYRFDDEMIVNVHVYGLLAAYTPVMHIRRLDGAYFNTYLESFERVWASARPLDGGEG
ncbi:XRE family transcriptional regulator, partial [Actinomadura adrarensis]